MEVGTVECNTGFIRKILCLKTGSVRGVVGTVTEGYRTSHFRAIESVPDSEVREICHSKNVVVRDNPVNENTTRECTSQERECVGFKWTRKF